MSIMYILLAASERREGVRGAACAAAGAAGVAACSTKTGAGTGCPAEVARRAGAWPPSSDRYPFSSSHRQRVGSEQGDQIVAIASPIAEDQHATLGQVEAGRGLGLQRGSRAFGLAERHGVIPPGCVA
jgi:hypothetical protein